MTRGTFRFYSKTIYSGKFRALFPRFLAVLLGLGSISNMVLYPANAWNQAPAETEEQVLKDIQEFWHLRWQRFRYAPTSPAAVWNGYYLEDGQGLSLTLNHDSTLTAQVQNAAKHKPGSLFLKYEHSMFVLDRNSHPFLEKQIRWDAKTLQGQWTPVNSDSPLEEGNYKFGDWPLSLSKHPPYGRILIFKPLKKRPVDLAPFDRFPVNLRFRISARLIPEPSEHEVQVETSRGLQSIMKKVGILKFTFKGTTYQLEAYRDSDTGPNELFIIFRDATTGKVTYSVGRYLEAHRVSEAVFSLDFNQSYLPLCAYSPHYNCPIPPAANHLPFSVRAGEKNRPHTPSNQTGM